MNRCDISELTGKLTSELNVIDTNHALANAVLNQKYRIALSKGIKIMFITNDLFNISMDSDDLVIWYYVKKKYKLNRKIYPF